ncbi:tubulin-like doman-containing protein [uncultured Thiodictyon sp.]|uniref:tubulin-like doman-containing protein n=1 Tax=uncultured Thiodictyon sp. TaxID=1846217 RepID=UPI0025DF3DF8|nr:tubulin-like doman-containing protein [uncultured Thiodictyon sp.]
MADSDYRAEQGTITPAFFIGVGGVGSRIVDRIAARAASLPNWESQLRPLTAFISIDTNDLDQDALKSIPKGNRINIAAFDKQKVVEHLRRSNDPQTAQWLPTTYNPREGVKPGAGQIRIESRLGFFFHSPAIAQRLKDLVNQALTPGITWRKQGKFNIYLFSTLAGGTGSGSFLSLAYLVDEIVKRANWQPRVIANLLLSTLMTDKVGPELHTNIHANTYAALKELESLTKLDYAQVKQSGRTAEPFQYVRNESSRDKLSVSARPFFVSFILDRPPHVGTRDPEKVIADAAFLQVFTPVINELAGEYDNYEQHLESLTRFPGDLSDVGEGFTKNFGTFGAVALVLPGADLLEYCALRFAAQALRAQITFGVDEAAVADDRARALAKLAVDYNSPRFAQMSDEGREELINASFVSCVRELARQDANEELFDGYWYRLVESVDTGAVTGTTEKGVEVRADTLVQKVERRLAEQREVLINRIAIKDRTMFFQKEQANAYIDMVSKLEEEVRLGHQLVDGEAPGLVMAAREGDAVTGLKLDPIQERYLVVRLLEVCGKTWLTTARQDEQAAEGKDIVKSQKKRAELRDVTYENLRKAAASRRLFNRDQDFIHAKEEAQAVYTQAKTAALRYLDARVRLMQLRGLLEFLQGRSRQYVRLATRMDGLVKELEKEAARLQAGETAVVPSYSMRVEVFETLDEPRRRIWQQVWSRLFIEDGHFVSTFDRQALAQAISEQLKPVVQDGGRVVAKGVDQTVADLRRALTQLGRERLRGAIFGGEGQPGLDVISGLNLEAKLILEPNKPPGESVTDDEIAAYRKRKLLALGQLAGVMARVSAAESGALDDGVVTNRTRLVVLGVDTDAGGRGAQAFKDGLIDVLSDGGRQVKTTQWHDPRLIIVHDVVMPIPLYYFEALIDEIEPSYLKLAGDERRGFRLHTDSHWEDALPNLNPRRAEVSAGWALKTLTTGLIARVIGVDAVPVEGAEADLFVWRRAGGEPFVLGAEFVLALAKVGAIHDDLHLRASLEDQIRQQLGAMSGEARQIRRLELIGQLTADLDQISVKRVQGLEVSAYDYLNGPVMRALLHGLKELPPDPQAPREVRREQKRY